MIMKIQYCPHTAVIVLIFGVTLQHCLVFSTGTTKCPIFAVLDRRNNIEKQMEIEAKVAPIVLYYT